MARLIWSATRPERLWQESFKVWFPKGKTDPQIVLIAVSTVDAEYWDNSGVNGVSYLAKSAKAYLSGTTPDISEEQHGRVVMMP